MDSKLFLEILKRIEEMGGVFGPFLATLVSNIIRQQTTITYSDEQARSFAENREKALRHRADDVLRGSGHGGQP